MDDERGLRGVILWTLSRFWQGCWKGLNSSAAGKEEREAGMVRMGAQRKRRRGAGRAGGCRGGRGGGGEKEAKG